MKKSNNITLNLLKRAAFFNAKKEAQSACMFIGYQPKMPEKVRNLKENKK